MAYNPTLQLSKGFHKTRLNRNGPMFSKKRKVYAGAEVSPSPSIQAYIEKEGKLGGILTPKLNNLALNTSGELNNKYF